LGYSSNFELTRVEDMHFAAALMSKGFALHGCEMTGDGWGRFALIVPDARKHEVEALAAVSKASTPPRTMCSCPTEHTAGHWMSCAAY